MYQGLKYTPMFWELISIFRYLNPKSTLSVEIDFGNLISTPKTMGITHACDTPKHKYLLVYKLYYCMGMRFLISDFYFYRQKVIL